MFVLNINPIALPCGAPCIRLVVLLVEVRTPGRDRCSATLGPA